MKKIGNSENGDVIFTATESEYSALTRLDNAAQGRSFWGDISSTQYVFSGNFTDALNAVIEWCSIKNRKNSLQKILDEMDTVLGAVK